MAPSRPATRNRLIETAADLFYARGYEATGVAAILAAAGVNSGSLYYCFKTKEELLLAVLDRYQSRLLPALLESARTQTSDPLGQVFALFRGYRQVLEESECRDGCPIGKLALEMNHRSEPVQRNIAEYFRNLAAAIHSFLEEATNQFPPEIDLTDLSNFILSLLQGALLQSEARSTLEPFDASVALLRDYLYRLTGDPEVGVLKSNAVERVPVAAF